MEKVKAAIHSSARVMIALVITLLMGCADSPEIDNVAKSMRHIDEGDGCVSDRHRAYRDSMHKRIEPIPSVMMKGSGYETYVSDPVTRCIGNGTDLPKIEIVYTMRSRNVDKWNGSKRYGFNMELAKAIAQRSCGVKHTALDIADLKLIINHVIIYKTLSDC